MKNELTLEAARTLPDTALLAAIRDGLSRMEDGMIHACIAVAAAEERGLEFGILPPAFAYAADIAEGRLSPHAAIMVARIPHAARSIMRLPIALQDNIADGRKIKVAIVDNGRIMSREMTIFEMSQEQMRVVFSDEGITPWEQQGEWLIKSGKASEQPKARRAVFKTHKATGQMWVSRLGAFTEADIIPMLAAHGYELRRLRGWKGASHDKPTEAATDRGRQG